MAEFHGQVSDVGPQTGHVLVLDCSRTGKGEQLRTFNLWICNQSAIPKHGDSKIMAESILLIGQVGGEFIQVGMGQSGEADAEQN